MSIWKTSVEEHPGQASTRLWTAPHEEAARRGTTPTEADFCLAHLETKPRRSVTSSWKAHIGQGCHNPQTKPGAICWFIATAHGVRKWGIDARVVFMADEEVGNAENKIVCDAG